MSEQMTEKIAAITFFALFVYGLPLLAMYFVGKYICRGNGEWWKQYVARMHSWLAPPQTASEVVWHDEPPLPKDTANRPCWIEGQNLPGTVFWDGNGWRVYVAIDFYAQPLNGRRVCPITKPPEPTT